jgi:hypothetical protein
MQLNAHANMVLIHVYVRIGSHFTCPTVHEYWLLNMSIGSTLPYSLLSMRSRARSTQVKVIAAHIHVCVRAREKRERVRERES